uniref:COG3904 family protein n=1 Tax=Xanthomonas arboricola TaxID=56448 RepID=UPI001EE6A44B
MLKLLCLSLSCVLALAACDRASPSADAAATQQGSTVQGDGDHMVSVDTPEPEAPPPRPRAQAGEAGWPQAELDAGKAWISCATDYNGDAGDGTLLPALDRASVEAALAPCRETGLLRVRYAGKINAGFAALVWRLATVAGQLQLPHRILDLDSSGGQVEAAIRAGDAIGESNWTIWVREGSICHSACVFVLAAGDNRLVAGKVGIHRMMRISSKATSRAELNRELREVYGNVKDYLERNGVAVAVADLMMTVPNRSLRLLTMEELREYGLDGTNAVQDDLERIRQMRKCGDAFVRRKDAFLVAFDQQCKGAGADLEAVNACGLALKQRFGFPDAACPEESPLAETDAAARDLALRRLRHGAAGDRCATGQGRLSVGR